MGRAQVRPRPVGRHTPQAVPFVDELDRGDGKLPPESPPLYLERVGLLAVGAAPQAAARQALRVRLGEGDVEDPNQVDSNEKIEQTSLSSKASAWLRLRCRPKSG